MGAIMQLVRYSGVTRSARCSAKKSSRCSKKFEFYAMTAKSDIDANAYIRENFQQILGKVYQPFDNREGSDQQYFHLLCASPRKKTILPSEEG